MKKVIFAVMMAAATAGFYSFANAAPQQDQTKDATKEKIDVDKLPDTVKKTLSSDAFKGVEIVEAYEIKAEKTTYEIHVKKDGQYAVVNIDQDGNIIS